MIYGIPVDSTTVLKIDPTTDTATTFGSLSANTYKWMGGVLAPNGLIYSIPNSNSVVATLIIDPTTDTATTFVTPGGSYYYAGCVVAPNGCIYAIPYYSTTILKIGGSGFDDVPLDFCLSRHFNKL
jgi:hypothetical protein